MNVSGVICMCMLETELIGQERNQSRIRKCATRKNSKMNRYTARQSSKCQDPCKEERQAESERLADPGWSPIDSVAMGTGVSTQMKGTGG